MPNFKPLGAYIEKPTMWEPEQKSQQQALIEALRAPGMDMQAAPTMAGNVVSANAPSNGFAQGAANGAQLAQLGQGINNQYGLSSALKYGTNPGSQQTMMLAAQDAGF